MAADDRIRTALKPATDRVFFALWPDARVRALLSLTARQMHAQLQGRITAEHSMHLTLAFIGPADPENIACLLRPPRFVALPPFRLTLDRWGCWTHNEIGWAAPSHSPAALRELVANLETWLSGAGFELDSRAFAPHVTLIRRAHCGELRESMTPIEWAVEEFALVRSVRTTRGPRYETMRVWVAR